MDLMGLKFHLTGHGRGCDEWEDTPDPRARFQPREVQGDAGTSQCDHAWVAIETEIVSGWRMCPKCWAYGITGGGISGYIPEAQRRKSKQGDAGSKADEVWYCSDCGASGTDFHACEGRPGDAGSSPRGLA